jgi:hypothetical protein
MHVREPAAGQARAGQQFILLIEAATGEQVNMIRLQPGS